MSSGPDGDWLAFIDRYTALHFNAARFKPAAVQTTGDQPLSEEAFTAGHAIEERTLHVTVNSFGDWVLEKDGGPTPTRVAVKW